MSSHGSTGHFRRTRTKQAAAPAKPARPVGGVASEAAGARVLTAAPQAVPGTSWRDEFARVDRSFQTDAREAGGRTGKAGTACRRHRKRSRGRARPDGGTASSAWDVVAR